MKKSKSTALKNLLIPNGFKRADNAYFRVHKDESVQAVKICRQRTLETQIYVAVYSVHDPDVCTYLGEKSLVIPYSYSIENFISKCNEDDFTDQLKCVDMDIVEKQCWILSEFVLPRLESINTQADILRFYDEMDVAEYKSYILNNSSRVYPALALKDLELALKPLTAIFLQNADALESMKEYRTEEQHKAACERTKNRQIPLRRVEKLILDSNIEEIICFTEETKRRNISLLMESYG